MIDSLAKAIEVLVSFRIKPYYLLVNYCRIYQKTAALNSKTFHGFDINVFNSGGRTSKKWLLYQKNSHSFSTFPCYFELISFLFLNPKSNMRYFLMMPKESSDEKIHIWCIKPVTTYAMSGNDVPIIWATQKRWNDIGENFEKHKFLIPISPGSQ